MLHMEKKSEREGSFSQHNSVSSLQIAEAQGENLLFT